MPTSRSRSCPREVSESKANQKSLAEGAVPRLVKTVFKSVQAAAVIRGDQAGEGMEAVEGMMERMRLSAAEKKGIKIAGGRQHALDQLFRRRLGKFSQNGW